MTEGKKLGTIFVVCPIGGRDSAERQRSDRVKRHVIEPAFPGYEVSRSDLMSDGGSISHQIITSIEGADLVVVDMTGHNPNVFYEMAVAHGFRKAVVHIIQDGERIPFDVTDMRTLQYDLTDPDRVVEARNEMQKLGEAAMKKPNATPTPLSQATAFRQVADSEDPQGIVLEAVVDELRSLRAEVRQARAGGIVRFSETDKRTAATQARLRQVVEDPGSPEDLRSEALALLRTVKRSGDGGLPTAKVDRSREMVDEISASVASPTRRSRPQATSTTITVPKSARTLQP